MCAISAFSIVENRTDHLRRLNNVAVQALSGDVARRLDVGP
jgi:hypothetical protein